MQTVVLVSVLIVSVMAEDMQAASFWPEEHLTGTLRTFLSLDLSALVFVLAIKTAFLLGEQNDQELSFARNRLSLSIVYAKDEGNLYFCVKENNHFCLIVIHFQVCY